MSFGGFLDNNHAVAGDGGGTGTAATNAAAVPYKLTFSSPGLSLALVRRMSESYEPGVGGGGGGRRRSREEENESKSGSDNMDGGGGGSGEDIDGADDGKPPRKKRYYRHTPYQIQELEKLFKECPHLDDKQRLEVSRRLCLETRQVKSWFRKRRTQIRTQLDRHENSLLREESHKLRAENMSVREAMRNPRCTNCGGPAMIGEISLEHQHLRIENAILKEELNRVFMLAGKYLGHPISSVAPAMPTQSLQLQGSGSKVIETDHSLERSMYLELALAAMDELVKLVQTDEPLWVRSVETGREMMNQSEYSRVISPCIGVRPNGYVSEASRETGMVIINSLALVETVMDSNKWAEMFPCLISRTSTIDVISSGMGGTRNGALQLMHAELQVLSPLVPVREVNFLRFCKQHAEGVWAVVEVSIDTTRENAPALTGCRRLPSGCVVQDMPNGYSKVTWVEHAEYDENAVHELYKPLIHAGMGFGAQRWVAALQRQCECLAVLMSYSVLTRDHTGMPFFPVAGVNELSHL